MDVYQCPVIESTPLKAKMEEEEPERTPPQAQEMMEGVFMEQYAKDLIGDSEKKDTGDSVLIEEISVEEPNRRKRKPDKPKKAVPRSEVIVISDSPEKNTKKSNTERIIDDEEKFRRSDKEFFVHLTKMEKLIVKGYLVNTEGKCVRDKLGRRIKARLNEEGMLINADEGYLMNELGEPTLDSDGRVVMDSIHLSDEESDLDGDEEEMRDLDPDEEGEDPNSDLKDDKFIAPEMVDAEGYMIDENGVRILDEEGECVMVDTEKLEQILNQTDDEWDGDEMESDSEYEYMGEGTDKIVDFETNTAKVKEVISDGEDSGDEEGYMNWGTETMAEAEKEIPAKKPDSTKDKIKRNDIEIETLKTVDKGEFTMIKRVKSENPVVKTELPPKKAEKSESKKPAQGIIPKQTEETLDKNTRRLLDYLVKPIESIRDKVGDIDKCIVDRIRTDIKKAVRDADIEHNSRTTDCILARTSKLLYRALTRKPSNKVTDMIYTLGDRIEESGGEKRFNMHQKTVEIASEEDSSVKGSRIQNVYANAMRKFDEAATRYESPVCPFSMVLANMRYCVSIKYAEVTINKGFETAICAFTNKPIPPGNKAYLVAIHRHLEEGSREIKTYCFYVFKHTSQKYPRIYLDIVLAHFMYFKFQWVIIHKIIKKKEAFKFGKTDTEVNMMDAFINDDSFLVNLIAEYDCLKYLVEKCLFVDP